MKRNVNIWAVILSAIVVLGLLVGFFFLGYFSSAKGWIEIKEPAPAEEELPEGEETGGEGETDGEAATKAAKAMGYTVSLKSGDVAPLAIDPIEPGPAWMCMECGNGTVKRTFYRPASCAETGLSIYECDYCDYRSEETEEALSHNWSSESLPYTEAFCSDTKIFCDRCGTYYYTSTGTTGRKAHLFEVVEQQAPTCTAEGYTKYECKCGKDRTDTEPMIAHTSDGGKVTKYATCTEDGIRTYSCAVCGEVMNTETIPMIAHKYTNNGDGTIDEVTEDDGIVEAEATCTQDGKIVYYCLMCNGAPQVVTVQATGHQWVDVAAAEPTCTEAGHKAGRQCSVCEEWFGGAEPAVIEALGHDWTEWTEDRESCDVAGERTRTCNRCEEVETEQLEAGAHSWDDGVITKAPTCTESGIRTKTCELCGEEMTETVDAVGHKPAKMAAVAATCTKTGLSEGERCTACGITLTAQQVIPALGHKMQYHAAVAATETTGGNIEYWQCNTCGVCYTDAEGKTQISAEDTLTPPLGIEEPDDQPVDDEPADEGEGLKWWHWALIIGGAVIVIGLALVIVDQVMAKNKAANKPAQNNGGNHRNNNNNRNNNHGNKKR